MARKGKFKKGDRVEAISTFHWQTHAVGDFGTIDSADGDGFPYVKWDSGAAFWCDDIQLKLAPPEAKQQRFIVIGDRAAPKPFVHDWRDVAEGEAERLSRMRPGVKFTVYQAVSAVTTPTPVVVREAF